MNSVTWRKVSVRALMVLMLLYSLFIATKPLVGIIAATLVYFVEHETRPREDDSPDEPNF